MKHKKALLLLPLLLTAILFSSSKNPGDPYGNIKTADAQATRQTKALFQNLRGMAGRHILFGHQDALAYGVGWRDWNKKKSDVQAVCGAYPAVFGWDVSKLGQGDKNLDHVDFRNMRNWVKEAYKMGGVNTFSWHVDNFVTGGNAWQVGDNVVKEILPGGSKHAEYNARLDLLAAFFKSLKAGFIFKKEIPVVFRPYHEHTGAWFWWGQPHCSPAEFKQLWQYTVSYLRDKKNVHNLLWCYSSDVFRDKEHYLECYPGDEWVDVVGLDDYHDLKPENDPAELTRRLKILVEIADERGKVAAMTETGLESIPEPTWWTERLLKSIKADPVAARIAWVLVWRNDNPKHHYAPYPGHPSVPDFLKFCEDPVIMMGGKMGGLYRLE